MKDFVLKPRTTQEVKFLNDLLTKLGIPFHSVKDDLLEDYLLGKIMKSEKTGERVSEDLIMKKLRNGH